MFIVIPGIILYTFIQFQSTPAIVTSGFIGLGIVFCGCALVHTVFVWQKVTYLLINDHDTIRIKTGSRLQLCSRSLACVLTSVWRDRLALLCSYQRPKKLVSSFFFHLSSLSLSKTAFPECFNLESSIPIYDRTVPKEKSRISATPFFFIIKFYCTDLRSSFIGGSFRGRNEIFFYSNRVFSPSNLNY